jgi:hypothetical protein
MDAVVKIALRERTLSIYTIRNINDYCNQV